MFAHSLLRKLILFLSCACVALVMFAVLFCRYDLTGLFAYASDHWFVSAICPNAVMAAVCMAIYGWCWHIKKDSAHITGGNASRIQTHQILLIFSAGLFLLQLFLSGFLFFYSGNDASFVRQAAAMFAETGITGREAMTYFQTCRNNIPLYIFYILMYRIARVIHADGYYLAAVLAMLACTGSVYLTARIIALFGAGRHMVYAVFFFCALSFGLFGWCMVPYTDVLSIFFPILTLYVFLRVRAMNWHPFLQWMAIGAVPCIAAVFKMTNLIVLIAVLIAQGVYTLKKPLKTAAVRSFFCVLALCCLMILSAGEKRLLETSVKFVPDESLETSVNWFVLLGTDLDTFGTWSPKDLEFFQQYETKEEKDRAVSKLVISRFANADTGKIWRFVKNKILIFYNDGQFGWMSGGGFREDTYETADSCFAVFLRQLYDAPPDYGFVNDVSPYGKYYKITVVFRQFLWIAVLCGIVLFHAGWIGGRREGCVNLALVLIWLGFFCFSLIFESSARLIISYVPLFVLTAALGYLRCGQHE